MRSFFSTLILLCFVFTAIKAENINKYEYGRISQEEADMKEYPKDKNAEAVVLFDLGKSFFRSSDEGLDVIYERTTKIKVLSEAGVKYAEILIPYYQEGNSREQVYDLEGTVYNYDDVKIHKIALTAANSYDEKINNYWMLKKVVMPDVKPGSIFEYKYKISSPFKFNLRDWEFQWKIPVIYSQYIVKMVPFYEYAWSFQGNTQTLERNSVADTYEHRIGPYTYKELIHDFSMTDIPAFNDEEFITSSNDYITKIDFQLAKVNHPSGGSTDVMTTWEKMNKELLDYPEFGKFITRAEKIGAKLPLITQLKGKSNEEKFNAVVDYVKDNYSWNEMTGKYISKSPANFVKEKTGNVADINLFTIGLLRSAGLKANPVLLSTRSHGKVKIDYPFMDAFNYVVIICEVGDKRVVADATERLTMNYRLPIRALNDVGLIVQKDKIEWLDLDIYTISTTTFHINTKLLDDDSLNSTVTYISTEYDALNSKAYFGSDVENIKKRFNSSIYSVVDSTVQTKHINSRGRPFAASFEMKGKPEIINNKIYINPFLDMTLSQNPLKQESRLYPIDMIYPDTDKYLCKLTIPDGWKVEHLPANKKISDDLFDLEYTVDLFDDKNISITLNYTFKHGVYPAETYADLKAFFEEMITKGNEKIVLAKK